MQAQIQVLLVAGGVEGVVPVVVTTSHKDQ